MARTQPLTLESIVRQVADLTGADGDVEAIRLKLRNVARVMERCADDEASQMDHEALFAMLVNAAMMGVSLPESVRDEMERLMSRANAD